MRLATAPDGIGLSILRSLPQKREFIAEFVEHSDEPRCRCTIRSADLISLSESFDDQVNGAVVQMEAAAVLQQSYLRPRIH